MNEFSAYGAETVDNTSDDHALPLQRLSAHKLIHLSRYAAAEVIIYDRSVKILEITAQFRVDMKIYMD